MKRSASGPWPKPTPGRIVTAAVVLGLGLRLAFGLGYWVDKPLTHDEHEYLLLAANLAAGRGFTYGTASRPDGEMAPATEQFGRAPVYPIFIALVGGTGRTASASAAPTQVPAPLKIAQSIVGALGIWLISLIARRIGGARAGAYAALTAAVYPPLIWICAYALSEALYSVLALASAHLLDRALDRERPAEPPGSRGTRASSVAIAVTGGVLAGVGTLTRPVMLAFLVLAVPWLLLRWRVRLAVALTLGAALVIAPWMLRNVHEHGRFVIVATEGGITLWTGNHALARGEGDMAANLELKRANQELRRRHPGLTAAELERVYCREALSYIAAHPLAWIALVGRKLFYLWVPVGPSYTLHSARYFVASVVSYGTLLPFAIVGFWRLRRLAVQPRGLWLLAGSAVLTSLVFFPQERFRIPVIDPTLIVGALAGWAVRARPSSDSRAGVT